MRSNYCAIYACAMLHGFAGVHIDRPTAHRLFRPRHDDGSTFTGLTRRQIVKALRTTRLIGAARWRTVQKPTFERVEKAVSHALKLTVLPTLIVFGARHRRTNQHCIHCAIAVRSSAAGIEVLDPLAAPPGGRRRSNVTFRPPPAATEVCHVEGCFYAVDSASEFSVLIWDEPYESDRNTLAIRAG